MFSIVSLSPSYHFALISKISLVKIWTQKFGQKFDGVD